MQLKQFDVKKHIRFYQVQVYFKLHVMKYGIIKDEFSNHVNIKFIQVANRNLSQILNIL